MVTNQKTKLAYGVLGITAIVFGLSGYWLKCHMGISFSEKYSLSKYFPFNYLAPRKVISNPAPGILLRDSFDSFSLFGNWTPLWMREKGKVSKGYDANGIDNSRCLFIKSISDKSWSCSYKKMIRVREGGVCNYEAFVKLFGVITLPPLQVWQPLMQAMKLFPGMTSVNRLTKWMSGFHWKKRLLFQKV